MLPPLGTPESQKITGDWVLFHPVYTQSELKAVDVSAYFAALRSILTERTCTGAPQATTDAIRQVCLWSG